MLNNFPSGVAGIDIYHGDVVESFHLSAAAGIQFVIIKATQGLTGIDPAHADSLQRVLVTGMIPGSYEFFTAGDPVQQAQHFVNNAGSLSGQLPLTLDVETCFPGVAADALACANEIKCLTGHFPIIYCSLAFWEEYLKPVFPAGTTLWLAEYGVEVPKIACSFWQWSEGAAVPGVTNPCDCDVYLGTVAELRGMVMG